MAKIIRKTSGPRRNLKTMTSTKVSKGGLRKLAYAQTRNATGSSQPYLLNAQNENELAETVNNPT